METTFYLDDVVVPESNILISMKLIKSIHEEHYDVSKEKKLIREIHQEYYETKEYTQKQAENARKYFQQQQDFRDDLELKYG